MKLDPELEQAWRDDPQAEVAVIVHVEGDPTQYTRFIEVLGLSVGRTFHLTNTIALRGSAFRISQLAEEPWVNKIESDRRITTQH